jgi:L-lactate dehydrogenase complex protein LldF
MNADPRAFKAQAHDALNDAKLKSALGRLKTHFALRRREAAERYGDFEGLREAGRAIRDHAIANLDTLLETFERNVIARGGQVHWARDAAEARTIILGILRETNARTVTKGSTPIWKPMA